MQSLTYRILREHVVEGNVEPGEIIVAKVDKVLLNDVTAPLALKVLEEAGIEKAATEAYIFLDHYSPPPSIETARIHSMLRQAARRYGFKLYDVGHGIMHQVAIEEIVEPGELVVGADSHTTMYGGVAVFAVGVGSSEAAYAIATGKLWFKVPEVLIVRVEGRLVEPVEGKDLALHVMRELGAEKLMYKSVEFHGPGLRSLSINDRLTVSNMLVEAGVKTALFPYDEVLGSWLRSSRGATTTLKTLYNSTSKEAVHDVHLVELSHIEPMIAAPPNPLNIKTVRDVEGVEVDQVFVGSCTNGRLRDLAIAAKMLKGRRVKARLIITPASRRVLMEALRRGYVEVLVEAGAVVTPPGCGLCFGAHMGLLSDGEVMVSTANRNFPGRNGPPSSKVYIASTSTAIASAITGRITDPREFIKPTI